MRTVVFVVVIAFTSLARAGAPSSTPQLVEKGRNTFGINCAACHGTKGAGDGAAAAALNPKPRDLAHEAFKNGDTADAVFKTVSEGVPGTAMVGFSHLSEEERWGLTYFILELRPAAKPASANTAPGADKKKKTTPAKR